MRYRPLGDTGLQLSTIGFGAWALGGGDWIEGWGPQDESLSIAAIHRACELGINWIDTAGAYGYGRSEEVIGRALRGMRERPLVFTKCTSIWDTAELRRARGRDRLRGFGAASAIPGGGHVASCLRRDSVRRELEASLRRLQTDTLDLCQIHLPLPEEDIEEGWAALVELRDEGKVRVIGVSNFDVPQMRRVRRLAPIESLQPMYSLLNREVEAETFPYCEAENIGVCVYSPMASGLLTGTMTAERRAGLPDDDWRRHSPNFRESRISAALDVVRALRPIAARRGCTVGELAIAWTLRAAVVTGATVGFRSPGQVDALIGAGDLDLTPGELDEMEAALPAQASFEVIMDGTPTVR